MALHVVVGEGLDSTGVTSTPSSVLVLRISIGIAVVLTVPFLAMYFFGSRTLVDPTKALAVSREQLARQKTELKKQSDELRELVAVAELSRDAITVTDKNANVVWMNEAFTQLSGYTEEETIGRILCVRPD